MDQMSEGERRHAAGDHGPPRAAETAQKDAWDSFIHFARLFYEDEESFERDERSYKRTIAEHLAGAIDAFRRVKEPTAADALSQDQMRRYVNASIPAEAARALGVAGRR